jgi:hypothetical protein
MTGPGQPSRGTWAILFALALVLSLAYGLPDLRVAFSGPYVAQNDARQHVFWMERFGDPGLFPNDPIADYFQAIAPAGYALLYRAAAAVGLDPLVASKLLPLLLALVSAGYAFALTAWMLPSPAAAFLASLLVSQANWLTDDMPSGTPHAFAVPLLLAFLYHLSRRQRVAVIVCVALQGLIYPHVVLLSCVTLVLWLVRVEDGRLRLTRERKDRALCAGGLAVALAVVLPFKIAASRFGPTVTAEQARRLPEFLEGGRAQFFDLPPWQFWVSGRRSGFLAKIPWLGSAYVHVSAALRAGFLLLVLVAARRHFPLASRMTSAAGLLLRLGFAAVLLFAGAHASLFRLHLPSRYSIYSLRVILSIAAGMAFAIAADGIWRRLPTGTPAAPARWVLGVAAGLVLAGFIIEPFSLKPAGSYFVGNYPGVYRFFAEQPKDVRIATFSLEADNIPVFSRRSVLVGRLNAVPYQLGYYLPIRSIALDLLRAEYAEDPGELARFVERYRPDFFLVESDAFAGSWVRRAWIRQFHPLSDEIAQSLDRGRVPALSRMLDSCAVLYERNLVVLKAACVARGGS